MRKGKKITGSNNKPKLVVMIPAFNEEKTIGKVIQEIPKSISGISEIKILVIDDGSRDRTSEIAEKHRAVVLKHKYNKGLGTTFKHGIDKALSIGADIIVNIDADNQFNSQDIPKLINPLLDEKADMVTCSRFLDPQLTKNIPWIKKWGNRRFTNLINRITGKRYTDTQCGFRAYSKEAAMRLNLNGKFTYTQEVFIDLAEKGMKIVEMPLEVRYFPKRKSIISGKLTRYALRSLGIITRATRDSQPLTFFGVPGIFIFILGILGAGYSFWFWLTYLMTTPVRTLFSVSVFFMIFGLSLMVLALLADMMKTLKQNQEEILYRLKKER
jgi:glycosyltransferase involved in cell wall biosynthesis